MATWLVTGAGGGVGGSVCRELLAQGEQVRGLDVRTPHPAEGLTGRRGFDLRIGDVRRSDVVHEAVQGVDAVLHMAALTIQAADADPLAALDVNSRAFVDLMEAAVSSPSHPVVVFASTATLHNPNPTFTLTGSGEPPAGRAPTPVNFYAATKLFNELAANHWRDKGLAVVALRLGLVTFPWAGQGLTRQIVDGLVRRPVNGESGVVPCADDHPNWLSPKNAAQACIGAARAALAGTARQWYDVLGEQRSMREAIDVARGMFPAVQIEARPGVGGLDQRHLTSDLAELGVAVPDSLEEQLDSLRMSLS